MKSEPIDWGCPSGLAVEDYAGHGQWDDLTWRWEFIRRTDRYRTAYQLAAIEMTRAEKKPITGDLIWRAEFKELAIFPGPSDPTFGLPVWVNPLYSEAIDRLKEQPSKTEISLRQVTGLELNRIELGMMKPSDVLSVCDTAIIFDLSRPIAPQLEGVEDFLENLRYYGSAMPFQKTHKDKWITYLRILDARAAGASWATCAEKVMPPSTSSGVSAARAAHLAARRMQDTL